MRACLALLILLTSAGMAQARLETCQALFRNAPAKLGGHTLVARTNYEKKTRGAGYHLRFDRHRGQVASVFFFDRRRNTFNEKMLATELSVATSQIYRLRAEDRNVTDGKVFFDQPDTPVLGLFGLGFVHLEYDNRTRQHDFITLGVVDGCLVKLVYSSGGSRWFATQRFNTVLDELLSYVADTP